MIPFPISDKTPIDLAQPLPTEVDCVIIGGGIIGVMTGWSLVQRGLRAVVIEKGRVAGEQSSRNWGWIRQQGRDAAELPLMIEANQMWRDFVQRIGPGLGLRRTGILYLGNTAKKLDRLEAWLGVAKAHGLDTRLVTGAEVAGMMPAAVTPWKGGLWTASDMRAEPFVAVPLLARAAVADGLIIVENCAARGLDIAAGRVAGVVTEQGLIRAPSVVVAGGAWSRLFLQRHGVSIPQLTVRATVAATEPLPDVFAGAASNGTVAWRRREDGGYTLAPSDTHDMLIGPDAFRSLPKFLPQLIRDPFGTRYLPAAPKGYPDAWGTARHWALDQETPFERCRMLNPAPNHGRMLKLATDFAEVFPSAGPVRLRMGWAGMIDTMPDIVPVLDHAPQIPGLTISTGMSGHGFGIGPAWGKATAALVAGLDPGHDLTRFRLSRFSDGSRLTLGPWL